MNQPSSALAETIRIEGTALLATLVRVVGDLQIAEDAVQEAAIRAIEQWPRTGIPRQPRAWLTVTAKRVAIDVLRREASRTTKERATMDFAVTDTPCDIADDQLRLIFTCCHPALAREAQVTLALRVLCGLSIPQISAVLLRTESAVAKRLTRTRAKIARAHIPYRIPDATELPERLGGVCSVVHAVYTVAHSAIGGPQLSDVDGCREAIRLARLIHALLPDEPTPMALLALMLVTEGRRGARIDAAGDPVVLAEQDRRRWDAVLMAEGTRLLNESLRRTGFIADPYQLEAAIAAEHAHAASYDTTDWAEIVRLYDLLLSVRPTPSARLARAVAVAELSDPAAALAELAAIAPDHRWHAVRAELLARGGDYAGAIHDMTLSLTAESNVPERRHRQSRVAAWRALQ